MPDDFKYQLSVKIEGQHLLNLRASTPEEFEAQLKWAAEHKEPVLIACAALGSVERHEQARPAATPRPAAVSSPGASGREIGPIILEGVEMKRGPKDGPPWKSPMYVLRYEGSSVSTFDALNGKAAMGFWTSGAPCYLTVEPSPKNPRFTNLISIRSAVAS